MWEKSGRDGEMISSKKRGQKEEKEKEIGEVVGVERKNSKKDEVE